MLFLRENSQQLASFKFIECHWPMIRLFFIYSIKKGIISAPFTPCYYRAMGAATPSALPPPSSVVPGCSSMAYCHVPWCIMVHVVYPDTVLWGKPIYHGALYYAMVHKHDGTAIYHGAS